MALPGAGGLQTGLEQCGRPDPALPPALPLSWRTIPALDVMLLGWEPGLGTKGEVKNLGGFCGDARGRGSSSESTFFFLF